MPTAHDLFSSFVRSERSRHVTRLRFAALLCVLLLALLSQTRWLVLRPGLAILLAGQAGVAIALFLRTNQLSRTLDRGVLAEDSFAAWFGAETRFVTRLALFESLCQIAGFLALGYEFWVATRSQWLALAIAILYPATMYFGVTRARNRKTMQHLTAKKEEIAASRDNRNSLT